MNAIMNPPAVMPARDGAKPARSCQVVAARTPSGIGVPSDCRAARLNWVWITLPSSVVVSTAASRAMNVQAIRCRITVRLGWLYR